MTIKTQNKILVVMPNWVGDAIMAQSLLINLKELFPNAQIDALARKHLIPLMQRMEEINEVIENPFSQGNFSFRKMQEFSKTLVNKYEKAFVLPNSFKSALIPFLAKIPHRVGYKGEMRYVLLNEVHHLDKQKLPLMVERYANLAYQNDNCKIKFKNPHLKTFVLDKTIIERFNINLDKKIICFAPGAEFGNAKKYPAEKYAQLAKLKIEDDYQIILLGGKGDKQDCVEIAKIVNNDNLLDLSGLTSLEQAIDIMKLAEVVISNDSGLMHAAAAIAIPVIAIFGPTSPLHTPPLTNQQIIIQEKQACAPCFKRICPYKHNNCMNEIPFAKLLNAVNDFAPNLNTSENYENLNS